MEGLFTLIMVAVFIEGLISYGKVIAKEHRLQWQICVSLLVSLFVCWNANISFFALLGLEEKLPVLGVITTAIVFSRGSNYLFEMFKQLTRWRDVPLDTKVETAQKTLIEAEDLLEKAGKEEELVIELEEERPLFQQLDKESGVVVAEFSTIEEACESLDKDPKKSGKFILACLTGARESVYGYKWKYINE